MTFNKCRTMSLSNEFIFTRSQFWSSCIVVACVCVRLCVCPSARVSVNTEPVCAITQHAFKFDIVFESQQSCLHPGCAHLWRMRDTLIQRTKVRRLQSSPRKFGRTNHRWDCDIRDPRACPTRYLVPHLARYFKIPEFHRNCRATYGIVTSTSIHSNWK